MLIITAWRLTPLAFALMVIAIAMPAAAAEQRHARLLYVRGSGAETCPDEEAIRQAVAARLGYEAFKADAILGIAVSVSKDEHLLRARVLLERANGQSIGERELTSGPYECTELASAIELAISIAIDPHVLTRQAPRSGATRSPGLSTAPTVFQQSVVPSFHIGLGATGSLGLLSQVSLGVSVNGWAQWARLSLGLEVQVDLRVQYPIGGGQVEAALLAGSVVTCLNASWCGACLLGSGGVMRVIGRGFDDSRFHGLRAARGLCDARPRRSYGNRDCRCRGGSVEHRVLSCAQ